MNRFCSTPSTIASTTNYQLTIVLFFTIHSVVVGQDKPSAVKNSNVEWNTLNDTKYSIQYPAQWELDQSGQMGTSFILFSPMESAEDKFRENVNLLIQNLAGHNIDLDKYVEVSEKQVSSMITNSTLIKSKRVKSKGDEYHHMIYTGDQGIYHLRYEQYMWVKDQHAFVLSFTSEQSKAADFQDIGEKILNSFKLK